MEISEELPQTMESLKCLIEIKVVSLPISSVFMVLIHFRIFCLGDIKFTRSIEISGHTKIEGGSHSDSKNEPTVTIITVVLNGEKKLYTSINSVKNLTYENIEYIVIDGASKDKTVSIIREHESFIDFWVSEPDLGVYDAMNKGIAASHGDYILFLGADDSLYDVIHELVDKFDNKRLSYYGDVILSKNKEKYAGRFYSLKLFRKNIPHQAIFYSKYVFDSDKFNLKYPMLADYALNLKVFSKKNLGFKYIPKTIAKYNNEDGLSSTVVDCAFSQDKPELIKKYYSIFYYVIYRLVRFVVKKK